MRCPAQGGALLSSRGTYSAHTGCIAAECGACKPAVFHKCWQQCSFNRQMAAP